MKHNVQNVFEIAVLKAFRAQKVRQYPSSVTVNFVVLHVGLVKFGVKTTTTTAATTVNETTEVATTTTASENPSESRRRR